MTTQTRAFRPLAATQNTAVTSASQTLTFTYVAGTRAIRVCNVGTDTVFINIISTASATVAAGVPILANTCDWFTITNDQTTIKFIGAAGGLSTLYVTVGEGM
jgi:hypothetical protein